MANHIIITTEQLEMLAAIFGARIEVLENGILKVTDSEFVSFITPGGGIVRHANSELNGVEG